MTEQQKRDAVVAVVSGALGLQPSEIPRDAGMDMVPGWDSVGQLNVCLYFQERFGVELDLDAIGAATSVDKLVALVPG